MKIPRFLLIDVMLGSKFICQLRYKGRPFPSVMDGAIIPTYDGDDIKRFVEKERPSLKGKGYRIEFSNQSISRRARSSVSSAGMVRRVHG